MTLAVAEALTPNKPNQTYILTTTVSTSARAVIFSSGVGVGQIGPL